MAGKLERKSLDMPDETRPFKDGKGKTDVVTVGAHTFGRRVFQPGWGWSQHAKPIAGTPSCQATHTGYVVNRGERPSRWKTAPRSNTAPGDGFYMPPGNDAWILGDKPCVLIDFTGLTKYAEPS